jgi:scavenger receptor class B, member 1
MNSFNYRETVPGYLPEKGDCFASIVNSTEGAIYPQFLTKDSVLEYWRKSLCRKVPLYFEKDVDYDSLKLYKYTLPANVYDRLDNLTADCYKGNSNLLPNGLTDISKCFFGK